LRSRVGGVIPRKSSLSQGLRLVFGLGRGGRVFVGCDLDEPVFVAQLGDVTCCGAAKGGREPGFDGYEAGRLDRPHDRGGRV